MIQKVMYPGMVNSPETTITNNINESDTIIYVLDPARVPEPPNLMTLGTGTNAETVKVTEINGSAITVERGFQGVAKSWPAGTVIARNFTEYDYSALKENIEDLDASKETPAGAQAKAEAAAGAVQAELAAHLAETMSYGMTVIRDLSLDGVQVVSLPFKAKEIHVIYSVDGSDYNAQGKYVETGYQRAMFKINTTGNYSLEAAAIYVDLSSGRMMGSIQNVTESGFEINWIKTNEPTGTVRIALFALTHGGV